MSYYKDSELVEFTITNPEYIDDLAKVYDKKYIERLMKDDELDYEAATADCFLHGICQIFAYALNEVFGYKVYIIRSGLKWHAFCRDISEKKYIDVRGITDNFNEFNESFSFNNYSIEPYVFSDDDFKHVHYKFQLEFARSIIKNDIDRYQVK